MDRELRGLGVLVIDDDRLTLRMLEHLLTEAGLEDVTTTDDPELGLAWMLSRTYDLVLLDLHMPKIDGLAWLTRVRSLPGEVREVPICVLTGDLDRDARRQALSNGAQDFITKPIDGVELLLRTRNLLRQRHLTRLLTNRAEHLAGLVADRTAELERARLELLDRLALAAEFRDDETHEHTYRVGLLSGLIAAQMGWDASSTEALRRAAPLHDVGKIGIPDNVLLKPGPLDAAELRQIRRHPQIGAQILEGAGHSVLRLAREVALTHHERWDGKGYPNGLRNGSIPIAGAICSVADTIDAITHDRPYRAAQPLSAALEIIESERERQFAPDIVDAVLAVDPAAIESVGQKESCSAA